MTTVPGPFYTLKQRVPALCALLLVALLVLAGTSAGGWPAPGLSVPALASLVLILPVAVALEILLGPLLLAACVACCVGLALGIPQLLDGSQQLGADTLLMVAFAMQGVALGVLQGAATRPFCFLPGSIGALAVPWWLPAGLGGVGLLVMYFTLGLSPTVYALLAFAGGLLLGILVKLAGLASDPSAGAAAQGDKLEESLNQVEGLLNERKLPAAQRAIEAMHRAAPGDLRVRQLRYSIWKFEPKKPQFHAAAGNLLMRQEGEGGDREVITALYKDYLAVAQGQPALTSSLHITLAQRFADWDVTDHAANIVNVYLQREPSHQGLPRAMLALAESYARSSNVNRATYFAETLLTLMPTTSEAHLAQRLLRGLNAS
ncbi:MAG: hypothetical protein AAF552_02370 [Pseudomonadota bacterium]